MGLGLSLRLCHKFRQTLSLHKKCKKCGENTNIGDWHKEYGNVKTFTRAVCWNCGSLLYPTKRGQKVVMTKYMNIYHIED